jgi:DNA topoisomerase-1
VFRHVDLICRALSRPVPDRITKAQLEKGRQELLGVRGIGEATIEKLYKAGIIDKKTLCSRPSGEISSASGIPEDKIREYRQSCN